MRGAHAGDGRYVVKRMSELATPAAAVWASATSLAGINAELGPWLRMTGPAGADRLDDLAAVPGEPLFTSEVLLLGRLPVERMAITLEAFEPGRRFVERSRMKGMKAWSHERTVEALSPDRCRLTDRVSFTPRFGGPLVRLALDALFAHRHRVLRTRFGNATPA